MNEDTFISHLVELRDRLLRALIAFALVLLVLIPFASELYDLLATPMMSALPAPASTAIRATSAPSTRGARRSRPPTSSARPPSTSPKAAWS